MGLGPMKEKEVKSIAKQLLYAVNYLHASNIAHRDINLENILIDSVDCNRLQIKLADFGFASAIPESGVMRGMIGSPQYVAPEILAN